MTVAIFNPQVHWHSAETAPSDDSPSLHVEECSSFQEQVSAGNRIFLRRGRIGFLFVRDELPHIAGHVEQSIPVCGIFADR